MIALNKTFLSLSISFSLTIWEWNRKRLFWGKLLGKIQTKKYLSMRNCDWTLFRNGFIFNELKDRMDLVTVKIIVLVLLGLIKLGSGLAPLILIHCIKGKGMFWLKKAMASLMCFGGGVLLSTVFIHMLPEVSSLYLATL